jgi:hypothetical protein
MDRFIGQLTNKSELQSLGSEVEKILEIVI